MIINKPARRSSAPNDVASFLAALEHPYKEEIIFLRQVTLAADPSIAEGIKWNAPSFRTTEYFATMHLRRQDGLQLILHLGAKKRAPAAARATIADPESLLTWLDEDRASVLFRNLNEIEQRRSAYVDLIRQWIRLL